MNLEEINQETLAGIIGGNAEALAYNVRDAHERGYFDTVDTVGDLCAAYVGYLVDMIAGLGVTARPRGAFGPEAPTPVARVTSEPLILLPAGRG